MNPMKQLITLIVTTFVLLIIVLFLWSPIFGTMFGAIQDAANETIPDATAPSGGNATAYGEHISFFRTVATACLFFSIAATLLSYLFQSHRQEYEEYEEFERYR